MQEKDKADMATKNPKKANQLDHHSIKHLLDESVTEVNSIHSRMCSVIRLRSASLVCRAVFILIHCFTRCWIFDSGKYIVFNGILQLIIYTMEKNAILFTYPPPVSFTRLFS
ncbi:hypothetical protein C3L33_02862, partial [Rhododendron williamsianum]